MVDVATMTRDRNTPKNKNGNCSVSSCRDGQNSTDKGVADTQDPPYSYKNKTEIHSLKKEKYKQPKVNDSPSTGSK